MASLPEDLNTILEARVPEFEAPYIEPSKDTVLAARYPPLLFHHLPHEIMPRGTELYMRMILGHERQSALSWRLRGEPH